MPDRLRGEPTIPVTFTLRQLRWLTDQFACDHSIVRMAELVLRDAVLWEGRDDPTAVAVLALAAHQLAQISDACCNTHRSRLERTIAQAVMGARYDLEDVVAAGRWLAGLGLAASPDPGRLPLAERGPAPRPAPAPLPAPAPPVAPAHPPVRRRGRRPDGGDGVLAGG